jgi:hypothetical protein
MLRQEFKHHPFAYVVLLIILVVGTMAFMTVWPNRGQQQVVAIALGTAYALWGICTHTKSRTINREVIKEYVGVALLGTMVLYFLTIW